MASTTQQPTRQAAADGKVYFSYGDIHRAITSLVPQIQEWKPDLIIAIGGGGYIPARMLRTELKIPILAVSVELYDDRTNTMNDAVKKIQWFDDTTGVAENIGQKRVLIVDEVDDTRTTLRYCVDEVRNTNAPAAIAVAVVHNKLKPKRAELPEDVAYFVGEEVSDRWNCYPWDAAAYGRDIDAHELLAAEGRGEAGGDGGGGGSKANSGNSGCCGGRAGTMTKRDVAVHAVVMAGLVGVGVAIGRFAFGKTAAAKS